MCRIAFSEAVKYIKNEVKSGVSQRTGKPYSITEATLFVPDLGRVKVRVADGVKLPGEGQMINLALSVEQGSYSSMQLVWDSSSQFKIAA